MQKVTWNETKSLSSARSNINQQLLESVKVRDYMRTKIYVIAMYLIELLNNY